MLKVVSRVCVTICAAYAFRVLSLNHCQIDKSNCSHLLARLREESGEKVDRANEKIKRID